MYTAYIWQKNAHKWQLKSPSRTKPKTQPNGEHSHQSFHQTHGPNWDSAWRLPFFESVDFRWLNGWLFNVVHNYITSYCWSQNENCSTSTKSDKTWQSIFLLAVKVSVLRGIESRVASKLPNFQPLQRSWAQIRRRHKIPRCNWGPFPHCALPQGKALQPAKIRWMLGKKTQTNQPQPTPTNPNQPQPTPTNPNLQWVNHQECFDCSKANAPEEDHQPAKGVVAKAANPSVTRPLFDAWCFCGDKIQPSDQGLSTDSSIVINSGIPSTVRAMLAMRFVNAAPCLSAMAPTSGA